MTFSVTMFLPPSGAHLSQLSLTFSCLGNPNDVSEHVAL